VAYRRDDITLEISLEKVIRHKMEYDNTISKTKRCPRNYLIRKWEYFISAPLSIKSSELDAEKVHELALDLFRTLEREADISAKFADGPIEAGTREVPITVGV